MTSPVRKIHRALLYLGVILLAACASMPAPTSQLNAADAALVEAREVRAHQLAPEQFESARARLGAAKAALESRDYQVAAQLAEQAEADAELAVAISRNKAWREEVERKSEQNVLLRRSLLGGQRR
jgi:hypothetical protein